ncbi:hypothetical protein AVEN_48163-1 [Araneus ventricosus]|uniref:Uncharacterized protein n=1 Tax=Araneus ventricosus TaxID=182803 RepID=A0A4Y2NST8_ARAVE|nr:hypothetical protein AVEN_48163-1 [Araneus ventricosus]
MNFNRYYQLLSIISKRIMTHICGLRKIIVFRILKNVGLILKNDINSPNSLYYNNVCYKNDSGIANAFADYFNSAFKPSIVCEGKDEFKNNCVGDFINIDSFTYDDVVMAIKELKSYQTVGVDKIPSFIIKG